MEFRRVVKDAYLRWLVWETSKMGHDKWRKCMFDSFQSGEYGFLFDTVHTSDCRAMFDENTRQNFVDWIQKFDRKNNAQYSSETHFEDFITLLSGSQEFMLLSYYLYSHNKFSYLHHYKSRDDIDDVFDVKSFSGDVFETKASAAKGLSNLLRDHSEMFPDAGYGGNAISLPQVSSPVLSKITSFFDMKHRYTKSVNTAIESLVNTCSATIQHIKALGNDYHAAVTNFVRANISMFPDLQEASEYMEIPTLARLTSMALGLGDNMKEKSVEDISNWYTGVSKLGMLPPLLSTFTKQIHSLISHVDFFS